MIKLIAREFIWLVFILFLAAPVSFVFVAGLDLISEGKAFVIEEKYFLIELYVIVYIINFVGIYLCRLIVLAIKKLVAP